MNINYKQPQFELFPANSSTLDDVKKPWFLLASLTLSLESLVILSILGIMVALFSFCLGVERGKYFAAQALDERISAVWNMAGKKPLSKPTAVVSATAVAPKAIRNNGGYVNAVPVVKVPVAKTTKAPVARAAVVSPVPVNTVARHAPAVAPVSTGTRFTAQLASYKSEEFARIEARALRAKGYPSFLIKKGDFMLVCIGQFSSAETASAAIKKLPPQYRSSQIRRF